MKSFIINKCNQLSESGIITAFLPAAIPVFMLHRVANKNDTFGGTPVELLERYLAYLHRHKYKVLTLDECHELITTENKIPRKVAVFTIDDGFYDHYANAGRAFSKFKMPLNFFLITDFIDQKLWPWDDQIQVAISETKINKILLSLPDGTEFHSDKTMQSTNEITKKLRDSLKQQDQTDLYPWIKNSLLPELGITYSYDSHDNYKPMSWSNAQELHDADHGVYAHTRTHRILSKLPIEIAEQEIVESLITINQRLGSTQQHFVYPTGRHCDYNENNKKVLSKNNIKLAFNTEPSYATKNTNVYDIPRFSLPNNMTDFIQYLAKFEQTKEIIRKRLFK